jgi:hypothetical protein
MFSEYIGRLSERPAYLKAYSDVADFSLAVPEDNRAKWEARFNG